MDNNRTDSKLPKLAVAAAIVAFLCGGLVCIAAIAHPIYFLAAPLLTAAGVSILRRRAWVAMGWLWF